MFGAIFGSLLMAVLATAFVNPLGIAALTVGVFVVSFIGFVALSVYMGE